MNAAGRGIDESDWERTYAPSVTRAQILSVSALYLAWTGFLALLAFRRWFGDLQ